MKVYIKKRSMNSYIKTCLVLYVLTFLASCGGGGSESTAPSINSPSVNTQVTVSTSLSFGGQISASRVVLNKGATAEFVLTPNVNYQIDSVSGCSGTLTNNTYVTGAVSADCTVSVVFVSMNEAPVLSAIATQSVDEFSLVTVQANATDTDGSIVSYAWTQTSGASVSIDHPTSPNISFNIPPILQDETLSFLVTATDNEGAQASTSAVVIVQHSNMLPTVSLQDDFTVGENERVELTASANDIDGEIVSYTWTQTTGDTLVTSNKDTSILSFTIPELNESKLVTFQLLVVDSDGAKASDTITLTLTNDNTAPENVVLVSATADSSSSISVDWLETTDNVIASSNISYGVHVSEQATFLPNAQNTKLRVSGQVSGIIEGLQANTQYYVLISAQDFDNNISYSNILTVSTMASEPVVNANQVVRNISAMQVFNNALSYVVSDENPAPEIGDIIVSSSHNGVFRRVIGVTIDGTTVTVQTENAALNEIYTDVDINTTIKLIDIPDNTGLFSKALQFTQNRGTNSDVKILRTLRWQNSELSLSQDVNVSEIGRSALSASLGENNTKVNAQSSSDNLQLNHEVKDLHLSLKGPSRVTFMPGERNTLNISATVINDNDNTLEVSDLALVSVTHNRILPLNNDYGVSTGDIPDVTNMAQKELQLVWEPSQSHIDSQTSQPYIATFSAKVRDKECIDACVRSSAMLKVKIHVGDTSIRPGSTFEFADTDVANNVTINGTAVYTFEPAINVAARIENTVLSAAHTSVKGFLDFQLSLSVLANAQGNVSGSKEFMRKTFSKTIIVGGAPVVIHGDFILHGEYKANAQGELDIEQVFDVGYYFDAGFEYSNGAWTPVFSGTPNLSYQLDSGAKSSLNAELTLIPEIQLRVYELDTAHIIVEPTIFGETVLEGEFNGLSAIQTNDELSSPYRFTTLAAGMETNVALKANFKAFDSSVQTWPQQNDASPLVFEVLERSQLYGIPALSLREETGIDSINSCQISVVAEVTPLQAQFLDQLSVNSWEVNDPYWTTTSASPSDQALFFRTETTASAFTEHRLRFAGHSGLGAWAKQYTDISFDFRDNNNDSLPDYWANKYATASANGDTDNDGISNADEFQHCTHPNKKDSDNDGMPDGWELSNGLNPVFNDANSDSDNDSRSNLQEFLDNSNPQLVDINEAPQVFAGDNQSVDALSTVTLQGEASDGGEITSIAWTQTSGPLIGLDSNTTLATSFTAPSVNEASVLTFVLSAIDNSNAASSAQVEVTVNPIAAVNVQPRAIVGADFQILSGERATLDGSDSFDTDGSIERYQWRVQDGQILAIDEPNAVTTSFVAPQVVSTSTFTISLEVTDNQGASDTNTIEIEVSPNADLPELSSIALTQLNETVVIFRDSNAENEHSTVALLLAGPGQTEFSSRVLISSEQLNPVDNQLETVVTEAALEWSIDGNTLTLESDAFDTRSLVFVDGNIHINDNAPSLALLAGSSMGTSTHVSEIFKRNRLVSDTLTGYRFTILENGKNTYIDFVTNTRAFMYSQNSTDIQPVDWLYTSNEQGNKELQLAIDPESPITEEHPSFTTWDNIADYRIVNISVLQAIEEPLSEVDFADVNLAACVDAAARSNNWLSTHEIVHLDCSSLNIANAQGLEKLSALSDLNLSGNSLVNINLSLLNDLRELDLSNNQLNNIDFTNNPFLSRVKLNNNNLSAATIRYLSSISWIEFLRFDESVVLPNSSDFVLLVTLDSLQEFNILTDSALDYDYTVDWGDGTVTTNHTENATHTYAEEGAFELTITGTYPALKFCEDNNGCSSFKVDLLQWGGNKWESMEGAFSGLTKFNILATDTPDLRLVKNLSFMFYKTTNFNGDISNWDVSSATDMNFMFGLATSFNGDISQWDTSAVTDMGGLFYFASSFNGDISQWNTSAVTRMHSLFAFATSFNTDISQWDTSQVTYMATMFLGASSFNGNLSLWDVSASENMNKMFYDAINMSGNLSAWNVNSNVRHSNFTHEDSLMVEPIWRN
jgi:surface protein